MLQAFFIFIATLPLTLRVIVFLVPAAYLEPYAYWSADVLNRPPGQTEQVTTRWRNMGYWEGTTSYPEAGEALARKLLEFANVSKGGAILDIAHGTGDSLAVLLSTSPTHLYGLTSQAAESRIAQELIDLIPHPNTSVELFVSSASYRPSKDIDHPLNPMRGYLGTKKEVWVPDDAEDEDESEVEDGASQQALSTPSQETGPPPYDLVYVLDAIYHFPPAVPYFLASVLPSLKPGSGVLAYTDILPPSDLSNILSYMVLPPLLSVPAKNLVLRPKTLDEYEVLLERIGYENIVIEDWSNNVWDGFAANLESRGGPWTWVARAVRGAKNTGWRFIAVRASRPQTVAADGA